MGIITANFWDAFALRNPTTQRPNIQVHARVYMQRAVLPRNVAQATSVAGYAEPGRGVSGESSN